MGYITLGVLALTGFTAIFGLLLGLIRGRRRAFLRLVLVVICAVLAVVLKKTVVETIMNVNIGPEGSVKDVLLSTLSMGDGSLPQAFIDLIISLVEIVAGIGVFYALFFVLKLFTWIFIFPFLKLFIRRSEKARARKLEEESFDSDDDEVVVRKIKKGRGLGALIGLVQGLLIAFIVCAPFTGLINQFNKLSNVEMNGEKLIPLPADLGIEEYVNSTPAQIYTVSGGWLYEIITSTVDESGKKVSIDDTCDVVTTIVGIADSVTEITESMDVMTREDATPQERIDAMQSVGNKLIEMGNSIDNMSDDAKVLIDDLVGGLKDMVGEDAEGELGDALDGLSLENINLADAGRALNGVATYIEKTDPEFSGSGEVTQDDVNNIVNGLAGNTFILDVMGSDSTLIEVDDAHKDLFENAISQSTMTEAQKQTMRSLLGLNA